MCWCGTQPANWRGSNVVVVSDRNRRGFRYTYSFESAGILPGAAVSAGRNASVTRTATDTAVL